MTVTNIINESGLYSLILRSDKSEAKPFRKWVTSEVLPQIRKHGSYATKNEIQIPNKTFHGKKVWLISDISETIGIKSATISYHVRKKGALNETIDYLFINGEQIQSFKLENQLTTSLSNAYILTESGLIKLLTLLGLCKKIILLSFRLA